jgi:hypothetical protein
MRSFVLILLIGLYCPFALAASSISNAKVIQIRFDQSGKGMVIFDQSISGSPACIGDTGLKNAYAFDLNTVGGKGILAMATTAKATGATLANVYGTGNCGIYGWLVEDLDYGIAN